jgi:hypothetical protein
MTVFTSLKFLEGAYLLFFLLKYFKPGIH